MSYPWRLVIAANAAHDHGIETRFFDTWLDERGVGSRIPDFDMGRLSVELIERLRADTGKRVRTGGAMPRSLAGFLASMMVDRCAEKGLPPPPELARLLAVLLSADRYAVGIVKMPSGAFNRAIQYCADHPGAASREIAGAVGGVSHTVVARWLKTETFRQMVDGLRAGTAKFFP